MLRIAELLPKCNLKKPSTSLSVEWFYMTFHKSNRVEYVRFDRKLCKETLQTLAEYFELIYNSCLSEGPVPRHQLEKS